MSVRLVENGSFFSFVPCSSIGPKCANGAARAHERGFASYGKRKIATSWLGTAAEAFTKPKAPKKPELPNRKSLVTES
jgi:hypothetical protein